uniref:Ribosome biogenesis protein NOP53 n=1 Tax=Anopheles atroparvus TaxID=41427 RepID=A0AAG5DN79_ANOAO
MKKLSVNPANKKGKKHVSRKLKSSWRKHIDTTDVDNFLEEKRQDERVGTVEEKQNIELFTEEAKPGRVKLTLRELRKKKFSEMPTFALPLKNTSQVTDPTVKRNIKINKTEAPTVTVPRQGARKSKRKTAQKPDAFQKDLWEDDGKQPEEMRSEWMGKEQLLHTLKNVGKPLVLKLPRKMDTADRIAAEAKKLPREGTSYNPAIDDYIELKNEVVEQEKQILKRKAHFDRVVTKMFTKMTAEEKDRVYQQEMSEAVNKTEQSEQEDEEESTTTGVKIAVGKRRKRGSKTKKREHHKKLYEAKKLKDELAKLKEINRIEEITEEVQEMEEKAEQKALKKSSKAPAADNLPVDFVEPALLAGSLRTIQPLNNLIATGLPKARKISIFKNSRGEIQRKKSRPNKKVSYICRSHKIGDA